MEFVLHLLLPLPVRFKLVYSCTKTIVLKMMIFVFDRVENIVEKGENAGYQHFLLFPQCFLKGSFDRVVKNRDCVGKSSTVNSLSEDKVLTKNLFTDDKTLLNV